MNDNVQQPPTAQQEHLIKSTEAMLDYAIIAGAELKNPVLVRLLRLARWALVGQQQPNPGPDNGSPT